MADNTTLPGTGDVIATDDVSGVKYQRVKLADGTADSNALIPGDATYGLDVDVTRLPALVAGSANIGDVDIASIAAGAKVRLTDGTNDSNISTAGALYVGGSVAHDGVDAGNPIKVGMRAINHGTNPTSVAAADRADWLTNRAGIPWVMGGHPNIVCLKRANITTGVTNDAVVAGAANVRIVVTSFMFTLDNASTVFPTVLFGFAASTTPTTTGVIGAHGGVPAGGGFGRGDGSGIIGVGAAGDALLLTTTGTATGNGLQLVVTYYTINEA